MKKILVIIGTRPEAIKMAPVIHALKRYQNDFAVTVCLSGQHRELLHQAIGYFDIAVDYDLELMEPGQSLATLTGRLAEKLQWVYTECSPDIVLVQGDTTTAFMGALVAHYNQIKVGHVEAGLRTDNKFAPFPEEINRRMVGVLADFHFAPTLRAQQTLIKEGVDPCAILVTGNTVIDALFYTLQKIAERPPVLGVLDAVVSSGRRLVLITGHRRENFGDGFLAICEAIKRSAEQFPDVNFVYPVHLNPNVQKPVYEILGDIPNVFLVEPLGYVPFVKLMNDAYIILTDSGGIQEEAPSLGKPVLIMRDVTERQEVVESGAALLVGCDTDKICSEVHRLLSDTRAWEKMSAVANPFGDGHAAELIVAFLRGIRE